MLPLLRLTALTEGLPMIIVSDISLKLDTLGYISVSEVYVYFQLLLSSALRNLPNSLR